jgi:hypothetical protein
MYLDFPRLDPETQLPRRGWVGRGRTPSSFPNFFSSKAYLEWKLSQVPSPANPGRGNHCILKIYLCWKNQRLLLHGGWQQMEATFIHRSVCPSHRHSGSECGRVQGLQFIILKDETCFILYIILEKGVGGGKKTPGQPSLL